MNERRLEMHFILLRLRQIDCFVNPQRNRCLTVCYYPSSLELRANSFGNLSHSVAQWNVPIEIRVLQLERTNQGRRCSPWLIQPSSFIRFWTGAVFFF